MDLYLCDGKSGEADICENLLGCPVCKQIDDDKSVFDRYVCTDKRLCVRDDVTMSTLGIIYTNFAKELKEIPEIQIRDISREDVLEASKHMKAIMEIMGKYRKE